MITISPGLISLTNSAPIASNAQLSEAKTQPFGSFPKLRGRIPLGSRAPTKVFSVMIVKAYPPLIN